jgi:sporulation protein YlmC with PRC-barrel domain
MPNNKFEDANTPETPDGGKGYASSATGDTNPRNQENRKRRVLGAGTLNGDRVRNKAGDDLGKIEEIMIDLESGRVAYAVLSFGGFLGIGDKLFMVPWGAMTVDQSAHEFVLDVSHKQLEKAPGFDKNNWPDIADPGYGRDIDAFWQIAVIDFRDDTTIRIG